MGSIYRTPVRIAVAILDLILNIANLFLGNIVIYETTTKIKFDWMALLHSYVFWGIVILHILYEALACALKYKAHKVDEKVIAALDNSIIDLIGFENEVIKKGDCDSLKRVQKALKKIYRRRNM